jgi:adenylate cyclase
VTESPRAQSLSDWVAQFGAQVGIVFADIVNSTVLLYERGTLDFGRIRRRYQARAAQLSREQGGRVVSYVGDEVLAVFPDAAAAFSFARQLFDDAGDANLRVRVGVHVGSVRVEDETLIGRNVHLGARVMQHANGHQLWLSDAARYALQTTAPQIADAIEWSGGEECTLKGVPDPQRLWRAG